MAEDTPLLDTLALMTAASVEACNLEDRELMLARIAALAAVGAPPASYLVNAGTAVDAGITLEDVEGVLIAVAPIVGTARVVSAAGNLARALGFAIEAMAIEAELESRRRLNHCSYCGEPTRRDRSRLNPSRAARQEDDEHHDERRVGRRWSRWRRRSSSWCSISP